MSDTFAWEMTGSQPIQWYILVEGRKYVILIEGVWCPVEWTGHIMANGSPLFSTIGLGTVVPAGPAKISDIRELHEK